jgi:hypothetical protein
MCGSTRVELEHVFKVSPASLHSAVLCVDNCGRAPNGIVPHGVSVSSRNVYNVRGFLRYHIL